MEVMLSGNFKESYISGIRDELQQMSDAYHELFEESSHYLEKLSNSAVDANVMKGIGTAGNAVGKFIGRDVYKRQRYHSAYPSGAATQSDHSNPDQLLQVVPRDLLDFRWGYAQK